MYKRQLLEVLPQAGLVSSKGEVRRLLRQGAIEVDGVRVAEPVAAARDGTLIKVGKRRWLRVIAA